MNKVLFHEDRSYWDNSLPTSELNEGYVTLVVKMTFRHRNASCCG